jgi:hypothetical protein
MNKSTSFSFEGAKKMLPREAYVELLKVNPENNLSS